MFIRLPSSALHLVVIVIVALVVSAPTAGATGGHVFWGSYYNGSSALGTTIGRADLDGSNPEPTWVSGLTCSCYVNYGNGYVWWKPTSSAATTINRVDPQTGLASIPYLTPGGTVEEVTTGNDGFLTWKVSNAAGWKIHDLGTQQTTGPIAPNTTGLTRVGSQVFAISTSSGTMQVKSMGLDGLNPVVLASATMNSYSPHLEIRGEWVYFSYRVSSAGQAYIGRAKIDGSAAETTWIALDSGSAAAWTASTSTHLYWLSAYSSDGSRKIYRTPLDGSAAPSAILTFPAGSTSISSLAVSPETSEATPDPSSSSATAMITTTSATTGEAAVAKGSNAMALSRSPAWTGGREIRTTVAVESAGAFTQRGTLTAVRRGARAPRFACSTSRVVARAGTYTLSCRLVSSVLAAQRSGGVAVLLRTTFAPRGGRPRTITHRVEMPRVASSGPSRVTG